MGHMIGIAAKRVAYLKRSIGGTNYDPPKTPLGGGIPFRCYGYAASSTLDLQTTQPVLYTELFVPPELRHADTGALLTDIDPTKDIIELLERAPVQEVQKVAILGNPTAGTFTLSFRGRTTTAQSYTVSASNAAVLTTALNAILGPEGLTASVAADVTAKVYTVTFLYASGAQNLEQMTATSALTGGVNPRVEVSTFINGDPNGMAFAQYTIQGYKRDYEQGLTDWAPGYVLNLKRS